VVPDVDRGVACTWHWISAKYHELVVGCVGFIQQIWLLDQPGLSMGGLFLCNCNGKSYVNGGQWLEPQAHLKRVVANRVVEGSVVAMLNIRKDLIPCVWMFGIVHPQDMNNHHVDYLCFSISLWVEGKSIWSAWCPSSTIGWTKKYSGTYYLDLK
jgi:hypothetical protein